MTNVPKNIDPTPWEPLPRQTGVDLECLEILRTRIGKPAPLHATKKGEGG
jgi:hypothetical protein